MADSGAVKSGSEKAKLVGVKAGFFGVKTGMTQVFNEDGDAVSVTILSVPQTVVTQVKTVDSDGYNAVQVGFLPKKVQHCTKAEKGHFKKAQLTPFRHVFEVRVSTLDGVHVGADVDWAVLSPGQLVDVSSVSKGKGFQGGMKRYNMSGNYKSHGASLSHRSLGSIGNRADPAKCFKNKKMPGHMGAVRVTVQNQKVEKVDMEQSLLLVRGNVPGANGSVVFVKSAVKVSERG